MERPTGEAPKADLRVAFDGRLKLEFHGASVTTDAGLQRRIAHLLKRPVGRPPHEVRRFYASFR